MPLGLINNIVTSLLGPLAGNATQTNASNTANSASFNGANNTPSQTTPNSIDETPDTGGVKFDFSENAAPTTPAVSETTVPEATVSEATVPAIIAPVITPVIPEPVADGAEAATVVTNPAATVPIPEQLPGASVGKPVILLPEPEAEVTKQEVAEAAADVTTEVTTDVAAATAATTEATTDATASALTTAAAAATVAAATAPAPGRTTSTGASDRANDVVTPFVRGSSSQPAADDPTEMDRARALAIKVLTQERLLNMFTSTSTDRKGTTDPKAANDGAAPLAATQPPYATKTLARV